MSRIPHASRSRRQFIRDLGLSAAAIPFVLNLPSLAFANQHRGATRRTLALLPALIKA